MTRVPVHLGARSYDVVVGAGAHDELATVLADVARVAVVSQAVIAEHHAPAIRGVLDGAGIAHEVFLIGDGEEHKDLATVERLSRDLTTWGLRRSDAIVALGGGMVGDTAGFAAAIYARGVDVVQVPTSLLAMVDAAIGGKTGVNLPEGKNLLGAFHQPRAVLADPRVLATLPDAEYRSGLGEVAKYALMGDAEIAAVIERSADALRARDPDVLATVIARSAAVKAAAVSADEHERTGARATLNYGHTLAHALETVGGYDLRHGEAVAIGLVFAGHLAGAIERIPPAAVEHHARVVGALGLPTHAPPGLRADDLLVVMRRDKKSTGGLSFVLAGPNGVEAVADPDPSALDTAFAAVGIDV
ncbi:MAG TPA: 3-dehydroquinate synthase [Acidimicrobiia bacterium]|nr:3-dehydroquinate synthase [Acidimicrobiia bacterium]